MTLREVLATMKNSLLDVRGVIRLPSARLFDPYNRTQMLLYSVLPVGPVLSCFYGLQWGQLNVVYAVLAGLMSYLFVSSPAVAFGFWAGAGIGFTLTLFLSPPYSDEYPKFSLRQLLIQVPLTVFLYVAMEFYR